MVGEKQEKVKEKSKKKEFINGDLGILVVNVYLNLLLCGFSGREKEREMGKGFVIK